VVGHDHCVSTKTVAVGGRAHHNNQRRGWLEFCRVGAMAAQFATAGKWLRRSLRKKARFTCLFARSSCTSPKILNDTRCTVENFWLFQNQILHSLAKPISWRQL
jgi:hypothetical protein